MLYKMSRFHQRIATNITFEELRALMLTLDTRPDYQEAVKNATCAYVAPQDIDIETGNYKTALNWIAVQYETIGSIKPMGVH